MTVYLAMASVDYENTWVDGVFSTIEGADACIAARNGDKNLDTYRYADGRWVEAWVIDGGKDHVHR